MNAVAAAVCTGLFVCVVPSLSVDAAPAAQGTCSGSGSGIGNGITGTAYCPPSTEPPPRNTAEDAREAFGGGAGETTTCNYTPGPDTTPDFGPADIGFFRQEGDRPQMAWWQACTGREGTYVWLDLFGTPEAPGPPVVTPQDLIPGAFDSVEAQLPTPIPVIAPADRDPDGYAYVQIRTFFWVDQSAGQWAPVSATAAVGGLSVTVTARPERMTVDTGDGGSVDCPGAPPALGPNSSPAGFNGCEYVYRDSSATSANGETFPVTVTIVWHATWQASNGQSGDLGRLSTTSATRDLPVAEIQAVVTRG